MTMFSVHAALFMTYQPPNISSTVAVQQYQEPPLMLFLMLFTIHPPNDRVSGAALLCGCWRHSGQRRARRWKLWALNLWMNRRRSDWLTAFGRVLRLHIHVHSQNRRRHWIDGIADDDGGGHVSCVCTQGVVFLLVDSDALLYSGAAWRLGGWVINAATSLKRTSTEAAVVSWNFSSWLAGWERAAAATESEFSQLVSQWITTTIHGVLFRSRGGGNPPVSCVMRFDARDGQTDEWMDGWTDWLADWGDSLALSLRCTTATAEWNGRRVGGSRWRRWRSGFYCSYWL